MWVGSSDISIINSTVEGNWTTGEFSRGGGISADEVVVLRSEVTGNWTEGRLSLGGGIMQDLA